MGGKQVLIQKTWRSEYACFILMLFFSVISIYLSATFPGSVIAGKLFSIGKSTVFLKLPLFWFIPAFLAGVLFFRMFNYKYSVDSRGVEAITGILSTTQRITRVRYEDIRSVETQQTLMDRFLGIGNVEIGTAATGEIEINFRGIAAPEEVQDMIQAERDKRQKLSRKMHSPEFLEPKREHNSEQAGGLAS